MARGPRFWALGVDSGPRGGAFKGILDPPTSFKKQRFFIGAQTAPTVLVVLVGHLVVDVCFKDQVLATAAAAQRRPGQPPARETGEE